MEERLREQRPVAKPRYIPWNLLVPRCWAVEPELCPRCGETMRREKPIHKQPELSQLLNRLRIGRYPVRPPPVSPQSPRHEEEFNEVAEDGTLRFQEFGEVLLEEDNVVQLLPRRAPSTR